ncbi:transposable element Tcb2 transposase [Trichonephila clavipes]|nr:transposable element Tcb2 transposase [Trichonephila clavipes]
MSQRSHLTDSEAWRVVGRLEGGQTRAEVAKAIGVSQSVISRNWNRFFGDWKCRPKTRTRPGSRNNPAFVHESARFGGGGVLVYGGISIDGRTDPYIIRDGPLTARRYRDEILRAIEVPYAAAIGDDSLLIDDNCRPHRANLMEDLFRGRNRTNGMVSVFSRHESNRARLGRSRKTNCWPPTTATNSPRTGKSSSGRVGQNFPTRD